MVAPRKDPDGRPPVAPKPKAKPIPKAKSAIDKERARQKRVRKEKAEDEAPLSQRIEEVALPTLKKKLRKLPEPSKKMEDAKDVLRAIKRSARKKVERYKVAEPVTRYNIFG